MKKTLNQNKSKDLTHLTDIYKWNLNAYKKTSDFYNIITDESLKKELMIVSSMHKDICDKIVNILK